MASKKHKRTLVHEAGTVQQAEGATAAPTETPAEPREVQEITSGKLILARIFWVFLGPVALSLMLLGIANAGSGWATLLDLAFLMVLGLTVLCRWSEQRSGKAMTAYGDEPSTWAHFRRYVRTFVPLALVAWIVANAIGNHILGWAGGASQP